MNKRKTFLWIVGLLILVTLAFIWKNSLLPREDSLEKSSMVTDALRPILGLLIGEKNVTDHFVRKLAHLTEFAALGAETACFALLLSSRRLHGFFHCLFAGLLAALIDETLQLLTDRGSQVQDVLLDFAGLLLGVLLTYLIARLRDRRKAASL